MWLIATTVTTMITKLTTMISGQTLTMITKLTTTITKLTTMTRGLVTHGLCYLLPTRFNNFSTHIIELINGLHRFVVFINTKTSRPKKGGFGLGVPPQNKTPRTLV